MKILHRGTPLKEQIWKGTCNSCKSVAEATHSEMTRITYNQLDDGPFSWEICPVCKCGNPSTGWGGMLFYSVKRAGVKCG